MELLILGAGVPHEGDRPSVLLEPQSGCSVLQWMLDAVEGLVDDVTFVGGYQVSEVRSQFSELHLVVNSNWESTGSAASFLTATEGNRSGRELLVAYGDIMFRRGLPQEMSSSSADISIAWDSAWGGRYSNRNGVDFDSREKVILHDGRVEKLGVNFPSEWASGEFIGLAYFSRKAMRLLEDLPEGVLRSLSEQNLSDLIEYLRSMGLSVEGFDVKGDWVECNEMRDIARFILGTKAETLARLQGVVKNSVIEDQVAFKVSDWRLDSEEIISEIRERFEDHLVVVRSSSLSEDSFMASNAGGFDSVLNVDPNTQISNAVDRVIKSYGAASADDQVLVQSMVADVAMSGVVFTRTLDRNAPWYVVNYETEGNTEAITSGSSKNHRTFLMRRNGASDSSKGLAPELAKLMAAVREVESLLSYDELDIEFAIDNSNTVHILQVRPIAVGKKGSGVEDALFDEVIEQARIKFSEKYRSPPHIPGDAPPLFGIMPDWNPAEIIGTAPGMLAVSLYRHVIMDETWAVQRAEFGYRDVRPAPLLSLFSGQPYVDVRASFASFLPDNLDENLAGRLLNFYLETLKASPELHDKVEFEVVPTCLGPGFGVWERRLLKDGRFSLQEIEMLKEGLGALTRNSFQRCAEELEKLSGLTPRFESVVADQCLVSIERAQILLDDCRRLGALPFAHLARCGFIAVTLLREAVDSGVISESAKEGFLSTIKTVSHSLTDDARAVSVGTLPWSEFTSRYGHLRPGTYDILSDRYDADPEVYLRPLISQKFGKEHVAHSVDWTNERSRFFDALHKLGLPSERDEVEAFLRRAIEGREYAKFIFSRNLSAALESLAEYGESIGLSREQVSNLPFEALVNSRETTLSSRASVPELSARAQRGKLELNIAEACKLPPLIGAKEDFDFFLLGSDRPNFIGSTSVTAKCVCPSSDPVFEGDSLIGRIVLITSADPGYDWIFGQNIAGLITMFGGANSHMAIRAAEFGLPAAIGVGESLFDKLAGAEILELTPSNEVIRVVR